MPSKLLECEAGQCVPGSGGGGPGNWQFNGRQGHGEWPGSQAIAHLTIERFDFDGVLIRRVDTGGRTPGLTAVYTGKIVGNHIDGKVVWTWRGHWNKSPSSTWYATVVGPPNYAFLNPNVLCDPTSFRGSGAEASSRAELAIDMKRSSQAVCWLHLGASKGDAGAEGMLATTLYMGMMGVAVNYPQAFIWASKSAAQGNYLGERCLSRLYATGRGTAKDTALADQWLAKADQDKAAVILAEEQTQNRHNLELRQARQFRAELSQQQPRQNMAGVLLLGLFLAGAMSSGTDDAGYTSSSTGIDRYNALKSQCAEGFTNSCNLVGEKPPNEQ